MSIYQDLTDETFDAFIAPSQPGLAVVYVWAKWCGPCKSNAPGYAALAEERPDIRFAKLDVDTGMQTANKLNITNVPTALIYKDGILIKTITGANRKRIEEALSALNENP